MSTISGICAGLAFVGLLLWALSLRRQLNDTTEAMEHAAQEGQLLLGLWQILVEEIEPAELLRRVAHYLEREYHPGQPLALFVADDRRLEMVAWRNLGRDDVKHTLLVLTEPSNPNAEILFRYQNAVNLPYGITAFPIMIEGDGERYVVGVLALAVLPEEYRLLIDRICFAIGLGISRATAFMLVRGQRDQEQARAEAAVAEVGRLRPLPGRGGRGSKPRPSSN